MAGKSRDLGQGSAKPVSRVPRKTVVDWLKLATQAIPQFERDERRRDWMVRRMEVFARLHGEKLATLQLADVLSYLEGKSKGSGVFDWSIRL